jgi:hypothetical protein
VLFGSMCVVETYHLAVEGQSVFLSVFFDMSGVGGLGGRRNHPFIGGTAEKAGLGEVAFVISHEKERNGRGKFHQGMGHGG